jgi:hypothetical protein
MEVLKNLGYLFNIASIAILAFGVLFTTIQKSHKDKNWLLAYFSCFLSIEISQIVIGAHLETNTFFMFISVFFIQFLFLTYFYFSTVFQLSPAKRNTILFIGLLPFLVYALPDSYGSFLQYYARAPYSFTIMVYSLMYFYALINGSITTINSRNILNGTVLLFFTLDLFLALGFMFMITENLLQLNAWFWFIRAIFLQLFYIALIYYGWKSSESQVKTKQEFLNKV